MLFEALNFIKEEYNDYLLRLGRTTHSLVLGNIAQQDSTPPAGSTDIGDDLVMTLINTEEENILRNKSNIVKNGISVSRQNPPVFLNLYVLFSSNINDYSEGLKFISSVIEFFQQYRVFTPAAFPRMASTKIEKLSFEIYDLNFDQTYNLWGILGGKLQLNVFYKVRLVAIQASPETASGIIQRVIINDHTMS